MAVIGGRNIGTNDLVIMGAGVLMFIASFLPWYGYSVHGFGGFTISAWHIFWAWVSVLLVIAVSAAVAMRVFGGRALPPVANGAVSWGLISTGVSALVVVIILLRWLTYPSAHGADSGARVGTYLGLIIAIVQTVFGYLSMVAAGERMPWQQRRV